MADFLEINSPRIIGIMQPGFPKFSAEEFKASNRAMDALRVAIEYYHEHGKLRQALTEVREVARDHWHPVIDEMWGHHFERRADDAGIKLGKNIRSLTQGDEGLFKRAFEDWALAQKARDKKEKPN